MQILILLLLDDQMQIFILSLHLIELSQPRASSNLASFSIDFFAENADLTFDAQGDDADVYIDVQSVLIQAGS